MQKKSKEKETTRVGAYRFGEFDLYPSERLLRRRQKAVRLPPKAFDALLLFVRNAERLVRRDELVDALWPDTASYTLEYDVVFAALRGDPDFRREVARAKTIERDARRALERSRGRS